MSQPLSASRILSRALCLCVLLSSYTFALPILGWAQSGVEELKSSAGRLLSRQSDVEQALRPKELFTAQFANPSEIISVLLLLGGDVVHKAIAQDIKHAEWNRSWHKPAVFSFGWVSYAFIAVSSSLGGGSFMPSPDCPGLVVNVSSGDARENRSWVIGRLIRDLELKVEKVAAKNAEKDVETKIGVARKEAEDRFLANMNLVSRAAQRGQTRAGKEAAISARDNTPKVDPLTTSLLVSVFQATPEHNKGEDPFWSLFTVVFLVSQLGISVIPWKLYGNWSIFAITGVANVLATLTAFCLGTTKDKFRCRSHSNSVYALTRGNGHKHVFIILPDRLDKENSNLPYLDDLASSSFRPSLWRRWAAGLVALLWVVFLITVGGLKQNTWFLFAVGTVGTVHNVIIAGWKRGSASHGISISERRTSELDQVQFGKNITVKGKGPRVRDTLVELEKHYAGAGLALRKHFLNGFETAQDRETWSESDVADTTREGRVWLWKLATYGPELRTLASAADAHPSLQAMVAALNAQDQAEPQTPMQTPGLLTTSKARQALAKLASHPDPAVTNLSEAQMQRLLTAYSTSIVSPGSAS